ncbi:glycosyltransferase [Pseudactinotalea suaedae]|uniref:glycosyltransferase n=1 Tax=Pseudactinotalea suaedae TaxID=1524924 RepID=UPI0012E1DAE2|nr:glycosyltransferase [Pseudactinotalea suaedae]
MLVGNQITVDTRVRKTAVSVARLGLDVTLVGTAPAGVRTVDTMAGVTVIRLPMQWRHRDEGRVEPADPPQPDVEAVLSWRQTVPVALDYLEAFVDEVVALEPDVIHAHDVHMIAVAAAAVEACRERGSTDVRWIYDAHEFIAGLSLYGTRDATERAGWLDLEREIAPLADAIVTVSPILEDELRNRYPDVSTTVVTLNAPWQESEAPTDPAGGVRSACDLDDSVPLLVYSGVVTPARGVETIIDAMPSMPGVHVAVVSTTYASRVTSSLGERAAALQVGDRVHLLPPVEPDRVISYLASADIGLIPLKRFPSHDVALTNKLFEYIHAGLPVVVSDCPAQQQFVREHDIGAVHLTEDPTDVALAVGEVIRRLRYYRERIGILRDEERFSWQGAEASLRDLYESMLGMPLEQPSHVTYPQLTLHRVSAPTEN